MVGNRKPRADYGSPLNLLCWAHSKAGPSKNRRMPLSMENTRYSLVKGERIVRFVFTTWLRGLQ
ncbi:hypothetical protein YC2023_069282 [Brassica napus]